MFAIINFKIPKKGFHQVSTWELRGERYMRFWMLILGIMIVSAFSDLSSVVSKYETTIAAAQETEPAPTPAPETESHVR